ncbi:glycerophosphodiester phosphodiesterase [Bacillus sp. REN3]|uniref:glycerophosphodiester phosphodiesterase n=1 Tax=Bacillus sp. REN3 TaxID=2802440 RepID=UPI001AEDDF5D|nr:glycerophosphodiester phosphodiesterase [Bacillus sp. REN3]
MKSVIKYALAASVIYLTMPVSISAAMGQKPAFVNFVTLAHRGASGYAPEHTFPAYELGVRMKSDYIEIDLQMTKDGELIAMHDETVDRTTNGKGLVKDLTLKEIKKLDAGSWFNKAYPAKSRSEYAGLKVPTLKEILQQFGMTSKFYIETKTPDMYPGIEEKLVQILKEYSLTGIEGQPSRVVIQSFSAESLKKIHQLDRGLPLIQLLSYYSPAVISDSEIAALKKYADGIGMHYTALSPGYVKKVRDSGLFIHPYTVNVKEEMDKLLGWGVTGMFTNYPDKLNEVMRGKK